MNMCTFTVAKGCIPKREKQDSDVSLSTRFYRQGVLDITIQIQMEQMFSNECSVPMHSEHNWDSIVRHSCIDKMGQGRKKRKVRGKEKLGGFKAK